MLIIVSAHAPLNPRVMTAAIGVDHGDHGVRERSQKTSTNKGVGGAAQVDKG